MAENRNFGQKSNFWSKIEIFGKKRNFWQKSKFLAKIELFVKNQILGGNRTFGSILGIGLSRRRVFSRHTDTMGCAMGCHWLLIMGCHWHRANMSELGSQTRSVNIENYFSPGGRQKIIMFENHFFVYIRKNCNLTDHMLLA